LRRVIASAIHIVNRNPNRLWRGSGSGSGCASHCSLRAFCGDSGYARHFSFLALGSGCASHFLPITLRSDSGSASHFLLLCSKCYPTYYPTVLPNQDSPCRQRTVVAGVEAVSIVDCAAPVALGLRRQSRVLHRIGNVPHKAKSRARTLASLGNNGIVHFNARVLVISPRCSPDDKCRSCEQRYSPACLIVNLGRCVPHVKAVRVKL